MRTLGWLVALLLILPLAPYCAADGEVAEARVTYLTGSSVYVDAGSDDGLRVGDRLQVVREDKVVIVLEVTELSNHRAVGKFVEGSANLELGELVRFAPAATAAAEPEQPNKKRRSGGLRGIGIRGRVGVRFLWLNDRTGYGQDYAQPALDLRLDGNQIGGTGWGMAVDVRTRRIYRTLPDGSDAEDDRNRIYRMAVGWQGGGSPWSFALGRQVSPDLATVSIFDGAAVKYSRQRWSAGLITGSQPDPTDYGYSSDIREHGLFFQYRGRPESRSHWSVTGGLIGSYYESEVNREFFYVQGRYNGPRLAIYGASEVDYNRDWKSDEAGEETISPTSGFISLHYRASNVVRLRGGYDSRRNVRLYRDRVTPETEIDDAFRQAGWAGISLRFAKRFDLGFDARSAGGGDAGEANAYTGRLGIDRLTRANLRFHLRSTRYENDLWQGWLHALTAGWQVGPRVAMQLQGGVRDEESLSNSAFDDTMTWYGLDFDFSLGRRWYLLLSAEHTSGDFEELDQLYTSLTYRF
jgi:hypothetical protein